MPETAEFVRTAGRQRAISGFGEANRHVRTSTHGRIGCDDRATEGIGTEDGKVASPDGGAEPTGAKIPGMNGEASDRQRPVVSKSMFETDGKVGNPGISEVGIHIGWTRATFRRSAETINGDRQRIRKQVTGTADPGCSARLAGRPTETKQIGSFAAAARGEEDARRLSIVQAPSCANDSR